MNFWTRIWHHGNINVACNVYKISRWRAHCIIASVLRSYIAIVEECDSTLPLVHFPASAGSMSLINEHTLYLSVVTKFWSTLKIAISPTVSPEKCTKLGEKKISPVKLGNTDCMTVISYTTDNFPRRKLSRRTFSRSRTSPRIRL